MVMLPYHYKNVRIVDIDGVLLELKPITEYFTKPAVAFKAAKEILNGWFNNGDYILLWTARPEEYRQLTMQQLDENGFKYHQLLMNKPQADDCIHIYDDANMEFHKVNKYQGLASSFGKENSYYDQIVEESRKAGKLVLPKEVESALENISDISAEYNNNKMLFTKYVKDRIEETIINSSKDTIVDSEVNE